MSSGPFDWWSCESPFLMLKQLRRLELASGRFERKLRLWMCALNWTLIDSVLDKYPERYPKLLEATTKAEMVADGSLSLGIIPKEELSITGGVHAWYRCLRNDYWEGALAIEKRPDHYVQCDLLRQVFSDGWVIPGIPISRLTTEVVNLAASVYADRNEDNGQLDPLAVAVLSDALEEIGSSDEVLSFLRTGGPYYRGNWVIDKVMEKLW